MLSWNREIQLRKWQISLNWIMEFFSVLYDTESDWAPRHKDYNDEDCGRSSTLTATLYQIISLPTRHRNSAFAEPSLIPYWFMGFSHSKHKHAEPKQCIETWDTMCNLYSARSPHSYRILLKFPMFTYSVAALVATNRGLTVCGAHALNGGMSASPTLLINPLRLCTRTEDDWKSASPTAQLCHVLRQSVS